MNEAQVICLKCHTPVGGSGGNTGVAAVPAGQIAPAAPVQSVAHGQPYASAQLIVDRTSAFMYQTDKFSILINGQKVGEVANGKDVEISVPTGSVNLQMPYAWGRAIDPVTLNFAAGQKKKVTLRLKNFYVVQSMLVVLFCMIVGLMLSAFLGFTDVLFVIISMVFSLPLVIMYVRLFAPFNHTIEENA